MRWIHRFFDVHQRETLHANRVLIAEENHRLVLILNAVLLATLLYCLFSSSYFAHVAMMRLIFLMLSLFSAGLSAALLLHGSAPRYTTVCLVCFYLLCILFTIAIGTVGRPNTNAIGFPILTTLLPVLLLFSPVLLFCLQTGSVIAFCVLSAAVKTPALAGADLRNGICFGLLSLLLSLLSNQQRLRTFYLLQHQTETRRHLHDIINMVGGGIVLLRRRPDNTFEVQLYSDGFCRMVDVAPRNGCDYFGKGFFSTIDPRDREAVYAQFTRTKAGDFFEIAYRILSATQSSLWVNVNVNVGLHPQDYPLYYVNFTNITDQILSRQQLRSVYDTLQEGIVKCLDDAALTIVDCNRHFFELLGCSVQQQEAICQRGFAALLYPDPCRRSTIAGQTCLRRLDGSSIDLWINASRTVEGSDAFYYFSLSDMTELKKQRDALLLSRRSMSAAIAHANLLYWEYDPRTDRAYFPVNDCRAGRVIGHFSTYWKRRGLIHEADLELCQTLFEHLRLGTRECAADLRMLSGGEYTWRRIRYTMLYDEEGEPIRAIATAADIEEYKDLSDRFTAVMNQNGISTWEYDIAGDHLFHMRDVIFTFPIHATMQRTTSEELIESGYIHPADADTFRALHTCLRHGERHSSCTVRCRASAAEHIWRWYRMEYTTVFSRDGHPLRAFGSGVDVTETIRARRRYEDLLILQQVTAQDSVLSCIFNLTRNRAEQITIRTKQVDPTYFSTADEALRLSTSRIIGEKDRMEHGRVFSRAYLLQQFADGQMEFHQTVHLKWDARQTIWLNKGVKMVKNPLTGDIMAFTYAVDVSDTVVLEKLVKGIVAAEFDFAGLIYADTGRYTLFCYPEGKSGTVVLSGDDFNRYNVEKSRRNVHPDDFDEYCRRTDVDGLLHRLLREPNLSFLYRTRKNGLTHTKKLHAFLVDRSARMICIDCTDVTDLFRQEQKRNEVLQHALLAAQQSGAAKASFLSAMSHDIRTPLNAILGMARLAREDLHNTAQLEESCRIIENSGQHLLALINDILDMSKLENGQMEHRRQTFDLDSTLQQVAGIFTPIFRKKSQSFVIETQSLLHRICIGDPMHLQRILSNLLSNASKFTPASGHIRLVVQELPTHCKTRGYFKFQVIDTGIGMSSEQAARVFDQFYRVHSALTASIEGTGLGLAITKSIVESQGGSISVTSSPARGTTFTVDLPFFLPDQPEESSPTDAGSLPPSYDFSGLHILLVEDHPVNTLVAKRILENHGAIVDAVENGKRGYDEFLSRPPQMYDIIFMDVQMPVMNGYETVRAIRDSTHPQAQSIPIIAMTANAFADDIQRCRSAGMNGHLSKPISADSIAEALQKAGLLRS